MPTRRDTQREKVYRSERTAGTDDMGTYWHRTIPNDELQGWVDAVLDKRAIRARWGTVRIHVRLKRGGSAYGGHGEITVPLGGRNPWVLLHEIAHNLTGTTYGHGPEFAGVMVFLVRTVIGPEQAKALRAAYRANRVRVSNKRIPALRTVVPEPQVPIRKAAARQAERAERKRVEERKAALRAEASKPLTYQESKQAEALLRRAIASGAYGASGSTARTRALAAARALSDAWMVRA